MHIHKTFLTMYLRKKQQADRLIDTSKT